MSEEKEKRQVAGKEAPASRDIGKIRKPYLRARNFRAAETAFAQYCALGSRVGARSLKKLARQNCLSEVNYRTLRRRYEMWSARDDWQRRVVEYDLEQAQRKQAKREEELDKMEEEHALVARQGVLLAAKRIKELMDEGKFGPHSSVQLLEVASKLERIARGGATERIEAKSEQNVNINGQVSVSFYQPVQLPAKKTLAELQQIVEGSVTAIEEERKGGDIHGSID